MIWLIGSKGMLGQQVAACFDKQNVSFEASDIDVDITDYKQLEEFAEGKSIDWIINCSAYTAVDRAEEEQAKAFLINESGVANIARIAAFCKAKLIHLSTDYVFDGSKDSPYIETDSPCPQSVYGKSKLAGENQIREIHPQHFIIRISWLYGIFGPNFVKTMVRLLNERDELNVIDDQIGSPTYAAVLADNICHLIQSQSDDFGVFHYADDGEISWYDFTCEIRRLALENGLLVKNTPVKPIPTEAYPLPAPRPKNSRFEKSKIQKQLQFKINDWKVNLSEFMNELKSQKSV